MDNPAVLCYDGGRNSKGGGGMTLGERLIQLRAKAGLSQDALAERLGVSRQSVSKWENDVSVPDLEKLVKLSEMFGISLDELVKGEVADPTAPIIRAGMAAGEGLRFHRQLLTGLAFFLSAAVLWSSVNSWGAITVWPLLMCGTACLFRRDFSAILCGWGVWLALFSVFGPCLMWFPSGDHVYWMAAFWMTLALLLLTVQTIRRPPPVPVCWLLLAASAFQYFSTRAVWLSIRSPGLLQFFQLRPGGKFLTLYWLAMSLLMSFRSLRTLVSRRHLGKSQSES